jgi:hypothetical protein
MDFKEVLKKYINKEDYFYRLRKNPNKELLIYYLGIKMLELKDDMISPNIAVFIPNSKNNTKDNIPTHAKRDFDEIGFGVYYTENKRKKETLYDYEAVYNIAKESSDERKKLSFIPKNITSISEEDFAKMEEILTRRIALYSDQIIDDDDFSATTNEDGKREKVYQLKLMNLLNNEKEREKIVNVNEEVINRDTYPLEMEYNFITQEKKERFPEGRIDNILIDKDTVRFVEIKSGTPVIAGSNGIHKHLIDMLFAVKNNILTCDEINKILKQRQEILDEYKIKNPLNNVTVDKMEYVVICGYKDEDEKDKVYKLIKEIYDKSFKYAFLRTKGGNQSKSDSNIDKIDVKLRENYGKDASGERDLVDYSIDDYLRELENICPTKIYLANEDFTEITPFKYNE